MPFPDYIPDTQVGPTTYLLTSLSEIQRVLSTYGENSHTDDLDPTDPNHNDDNPAEVNRDNYIEEQIQRSSSWVMSYLGHRFNIDQIYRIPRIREITTLHACYRMTRRRGNQPLFEEEYVEGVQELDDYRDGVRFLDAPSKGPRAYMQSYIHDNRFSVYPLRVLRQASTGVVPGQKMMYRYPFFWL